MRPGETGSELWTLRTSGAGAFVGRLPGAARAAAVSPDNRTVAYLPLRAGQTVWLASKKDEVAAWSLRPAGARALADMTWLSPSRLIVSATTANAQPDSMNGFTDGLFLVDTVSGRCSAFRNIRGTEPNAAPAAHRVVYVTFARIPPDRYGLPRIRESLVLLDLDRPEAGEVIASEVYPAEALRAYSQPLLSPNGKYVFSTVTYSDVGVDYELRRIGQRRPVLTVSTAVMGGPAAAWNSQGTRVAFWGDPDPLGTGGAAACVWVYDLTTEVLAKSQPWRATAVEALAWSPRGTLAILVSDWRMTPESQRLLLAPNGDPRVLVPLDAPGAWNLPVWVQ